MGISVLDSNVFVNVFVFTVFIWYAEEVTFVTN